MSKLFEPIKLGAVTLSHRIALAPLTRMRATPGSLAPQDLNAIHYGQRATPGGLLIAEASQVLPGGSAAPNTPGSYSAEQTAGWRKVVNAIHSKGGIVFLQLWHVGRLSHSSFQPDGQVAVAPSAIAASGEGMTADWKREKFETPRELKTEEIPGIVEAYRVAAQNAKEAGFDGCEVHSANGYLLEQFLQSASNHRTDAYGGSIPNRCRLVLEVTAACCSVFGADRVGIRLSPYGVANSSGEADPMPVYTHLITELNKMGLAYLHLIEPRASGAGQGEVDWQNVPSAAELFRPIWDGPLIAAGNFKPDTAEEMVRKGTADLIAFGRLFTSNPDLVNRIKIGAPLTPYNRATFYGGDAKGYNDWPEYSA